MTGAQPAVTFRPESEAETVEEENVGYGQQLLKPDVTRTEGMETVTFPWKRDVAALVMTRGNDGWIIFGEPVRLDLSALKGSAHMTGMETLPHESFTVLRYRRTSSVDPAVAKAGRAWSLTFSAENAPAPRPIAYLLSPPEEKRPFITIPIIHYADPAPVRDPDTGMSFIAVPTGLPGYGMPEARQFVDFAFPVTRQGIAVDMFSDDIFVQPRRTELRVTSGGEPLRISRNMPVADPVTFDDYLQTGSLLPTERWKKPEGKTFHDAEAAIMHDLTRHMDDGLAPLYRLRHIKLLMAEERYTEARSAIQRLIGEAPELAIQHRVHALRGMIQFLDGEYEDAIKTFRRDELRDVPEAEFWRTLLAVKTGAWTTPLPFSRVEEGYIQRYPPRLAREVSFVLVEKFVEEKNYTRALGAIDRLAMQNKLQDRRGQNDAQYYLGLIAEKNQRINKALEAWKPLADNLRDNYNRARAEVGIARMLHNKKLIPVEEAIGRLERAQLIWRGDDTEREALRLLGQLYTDGGQPKKGLYAWRELISNFSEHPESATIARRMADTFVQLFNRGGADDLEPLEALSLYYEFRELTPLGHEGDVMIQKLADRLVEVDLLSRASALLNHQIRYRLSGAQQSLIGARLALIHLMDKKPKEAIEALANSKNDTPLPDELRATRRRLMAEALLKTGEPEAALTLTQDDTSTEGYQIATQALWDMQNWPATVQFLKPLIAKQLEADGATAARATQQSIIRMAAALQFMGDNQGLSAMRAQYEAAMKGTEYEESFEFLTRAVFPINHKNVQAMEEIIARFDSFIGDMKKQVLSKGLSGVIIPPEPAAAAQEAPAEKGGEDTEKTGESKEKEGREEVETNQ